MAVSESRIDAFDVHARMETFPRVLPDLNADNRAFWSGGRDGRLLICRCADCGFYIHEPMPMCPKCRSRDVEPEAVSGLGTVSTFTINYQPWVRDLPVPFVFAAVELAEQPHLWVMANIVSCECDEVEIGMRVSVNFIQQDDVWIPVFEPVRNND